MEHFPRIVRWVHIMAGVTWIGLLYYFNFVQVPAMKAATVDGTAAGISKHIAPRALLVSLGGCHHMASGRGLVG